MIGKLLLTAALLLAPASHSVNSPDRNFHYGATVTVNCNGVGYETVTFEFSVPVQAAVARTHLGGQKVNSTPNDLQMRTYTFRIKFTESDRQGVWTGVVVGYVFPRTYYSPSFTFRVQDVSSSVCIPQVPKPHLIRRSRT